MAISKTTKKKTYKTGEVNVFDFLNDITYDKIFILDEENNYLYSKFMICRWLSLDPRYLKIVDILNRYQGVLDNHEFHKFAMSLITTKIKFFIPKGTTLSFKPKMNEVEDELEHIIEFFKVSKEEAYSYYTVLEPKERKKFLENLKSFYGIIA